VIKKSIHGSVEVAPTLARRVDAFMSRDLPTNKLCLFYIPLQPYQNTMTCRQSNIILQYIAVIALCSSATAAVLAAEQEKDETTSTTLSSTPPPTTTTVTTLQNCSDDFSKVTNVCIEIACAAIAVNLAGLLFFIINNRHLFENPKRGFRFFIFMAVITVILSIIMFFFILLTPCPEGCDCQSLNDYMLIPVAFFAKGIFWLGGGIAYYHAASTHQQYEKTIREARTVVLASFEVDNFEQEQDIVDTPHIQQHDIESGGRPSTVTTVIPVVHKEIWTTNL
jgi:hypothetical protein